MIAPVPSRDPMRPNLVVVVSDDQGFWALGCAGNPEVRTPALDRLAGEGTRLDRFFCASPVCSPARASLLTGRMPSAHGVHDWIRGEAYGIADAGDVEYLEGLATTPEVLAAHGWTCGYSGKWHLGTGRRPAPGFSSWYAHRTGDGPYFGAPVWVDGRRVSEERYITHAITEEALGFLDGQASREEPFYLAVAYTAPHSPWVNQHPAEYLAPFADCPFASVPREPVHPWFSWEPGPVSEAMRNPRPSLEGYFAAILAMDEGIGRIVERVDALGLRESTVVLFTSDNGFSCGHHGIWGKGNGTWPLNLWEESVRVPAIVRQPGRVGEGVVSRALAGACDVHPTLLALAGLEAPEDPLAAGASLAGALCGEPAAGHEAICVYDEYGGTRMIRTDAHKYVERAEGPEELYDLDADPGERHDLAGDRGHAARRDELRTALRDWFAAHTHEPLDAYRRPVSGRGQLRPAREGRPDAETYFAGDAERTVAAG